MDIAGRVTSEGEIRSLIVLVLLLVLGRAPSPGIEDEDDDEDAYEEGQTFRLTCYTTNIAGELDAFSRQG